MSTIIIGVDAGERSQSAIAFGRQIADAAGAQILIVNAYPSRATHHEALRDQALETVNAMRDRLGGSAEHPRIAVAADPSPAHTLHALADYEAAGLVVVGSTGTGRVGRVLPGSTGERLLHGSSCAVAVVPNGYRPGAIRRIGVGYDQTDEARAAVCAAADIARALDAELEVIDVMSPESYGSPALMGGPSVATVPRDIERHVRRGLDDLLETLPAEVRATAVLRRGGAADELVACSERLDLLVVGSRGYGRLRSVLVGGVSGRVIRSAACPVIVVPHGGDAPLGNLFGASSAVV